MKVKDRRRSQRHQVELDIEGCGIDWLPFRGRISDLSATGFSLSSAGRLHIGSYVAVAIPEAGVHSARVVRTAGWRRYGLEFKETLPPRILRAALTSEGSIWAAVGVPSIA